MSSRTGFLSEISWFQVAASALAAVTAAWIASSLGVAGTLIGAALGSLVVTLSTAFYSRTLDKGKTLIVQTASGTSIEKTVQDGEIAETFREVEEVEHSPVQGAEIVDDGDDPRRLHWKTIIATTLLVLAVSIGAMGAYEVVTGNAYGADPDNPRIGNPLGGHSGSSSDGSDSDSDDSDGNNKDGDKDEDPEPTATPTPRATATTPAPAATTPAPTATVPAPTATTPVPTPTATPSVPAE
ncbi:MAG: hypothetical protein JWR55_2996 [Aeromicrobium sp.]|nr:hypothetical protein [Aeromicrobium sp.]